MQESTEVKNLFSCVYVGDKILFYACKLYVLTGEWILFDASKIQGCKPRSGNLKSHSMQTSVISSDRPFNKYFTKKFQIT